MRITRNEDVVMCEPAISACPNCRGTVKGGSELLLADFADQWSDTDEEAESDRSDDIVLDDVVPEKQNQQLCTSSTFYIDPVSHHAWCPCEDNSTHRWLTSGSLEIYTDPCSHKRWICYAETGQWCWLPTGAYGDTEEF